MQNNGNDGATQKHKTSLPSKYPFFTTQRELSPTKKNYLILFLVAKVIVVFCRENTGGQSKSRKMFFHLFLFFLAVTFSDSLFSGC